MNGFVDFFQLVAESRGVPPGWKWNSVEVVGDVEDRANGAFLIKGATCTATFQRGKNKGKPNWSKRDRSTERDICVTTKDFDAFVAQWERDTGKCSQCYGSGQQLVGSDINGKTYRPCAKCKATGRSGASAQPEAAL